MQILGAEEEKTPSFYLIITIELNKIIKKEGVVHNEIQHYSLSCKMMKTCMHASTHENCVYCGDVIYFDSKCTPVFDVKTNCWSWV